MSVHRRAPQSPRRHGSPYARDSPTRLAPPAPSPSPTPNNPGGRDRLDVRSPTPPFGWNAPRSPYAPRYPSPLSPGIWRNELAESIKDGKAAGGAPSICVLDTNTLISAWEFLASLYDRLLHLTTQSFLQPAAPSPPFVIVIPYFVMNELDGLKVRRDIGHRARTANKWILWALEDQSRSRRDPYSRREVVLPPERWPIQAQTSRNAMEMGGRRGGSVDEALVELCRRLQSDTGMPLMFCSNDTNARTRAAIERIRTFDLKTVLDCITRVQRNSMSPSFMRNEGSEASQHAVDGPSILLEQWGAQLGLQDADYRPYTPSGPSREQTMEDAAISSRQSSVTSTDEDESMDMASDDSDSRSTLRIEATTPPYSTSPPTGPRTQSQNSILPPTGPRIQNGHQHRTPVPLNPTLNFSSPASASRPMSLPPPPSSYLPPPSSAPRAPAVVSRGPPPRPPPGPPAERPPSPPPGPPPSSPPGPPPSSPAKPIANKRKDALKLAPPMGPRRGSAASIHAPPSPTSSRAAVRSTPYPRPGRTKGPSDNQKTAVPTKNGKAAHPQTDGKAPASGPVRASAAAMAAASSSSSSTVANTRAANPTSAAKAAAAAAAMVAALSGESSSSGRGTKKRAGRTTKDSKWAS